MYQYASHYKKQAIQTASPGKLIVMLYDGALKNVDMAMQAYKENAYEEKVNAIARSRAIILELIGSLDFERGGEIARNLQSLYVYILNRLSAADMNKDVKSLKEVRSILTQLRDAWITIVNKKVAPQEALSQTG